MQVCPIHIIVQVSQLVVVVHEILVQPKWEFYPKMTKHSYKHHLHGKPKI